MEPLLQELVSVLTTLGEINSYPETIQHWLIRDITVTAGLLTLIQIRAEENPRFNGHIIARFLADKQLKDRLAWLVKDAAEQHGSPAMLQCFLRHEETFKSLGNVFREVLPADYAS